MRKLTKLIRDEIKLFKNCWKKPEPKTQDSDVYFIESIGHRKMKNFKTKGVYR